MAGKSIMSTRVKEIRKHLGLSQDEFGKAMGFRKSTISSVENGKTPLSRRFIKMLETIYSVNSKWLEEGRGNVFLPEQKTHKIIDRIGRVINWTGLSIQEFCREINFLRSDKITNWLAKGENPDNELVMQILSAYPQISEEWLLEGKGKMLRNDASPKTETKDEKLNLYKELYELYKEKAEHLEKVNQELKEEIKRLTGNNTE